MIDPILSLAFSVHANRGVYALLLGSGISRSARIPTGWEVVLDLIKKLAHVQGSDCGEDPAEWYRAKYAEDPDYSKLLDHLGKSPSDRSQILRGYFEPTEDEREQGLKRPTQAHRAIARLMASGYVRVVVTTNFDRLLEQALDKLGIQPTVISTPEAVEGARPLIHAGPTVVKIHGDYLDERIKNTLAELESYDARFDSLLDRIWDEFGVVTCGWSADWDVALLKCFERCANHRFPMYWTTLSAPSEKAQRLIAQRRASVVKITGADSFFGELAEKVFALESFDRPHPLSAPLAVEMLKNYLVEDRHRIRLEDLIAGECERVLRELSMAHFPVGAPRFGEEEYRARVQKIEGLTGVLVATVAVGCFWGTEDQIRLWVRCIERLGTQKSESGLDVWLQLRRFAALLVFYAGGMAALAGEKLTTFVALAKKTRLRDGRDEQPAFEGLANWNFSRDAAQALPGLKTGTRYHFPISEYLHGHLREPLRRLVPDDEEYDLVFDRLEYLIALQHVADAGPQALPQFPGGRFAYRSSSVDSAVANVFERELAEKGEAWGLFREGLFGSDWARFLALKKSFDESVRRMGRRL